MSRKIQQVARISRRVRGRQANLIEAHPEVPPLGHHLKNATEQVVLIAQVFHGTAVELSTYRRRGLGRAAEPLRGLRGLALPQQVDGLEPQPKVLRRLAEESGGLSV